MPHSPTFGTNPTSHYLSTNHYERIAQRAISTYWPTQSRNIDLLDYIVYKMLLADSRYEEGKSHRILHLHYQAKYAIGSYRKDLGRKIKHEALPADIFDDHITHTYEQINGLTRFESDLLYAHFYEGQNFVEMGKTFGVSKDKCQRWTNAIVQRMKENDQTYATNRPSPRCLRGYDRR